MKANNINKEIEKEIKTAYNAVLKNKTTENCFALQKVCKANKVKLSSIIKNAAFEVDFSAENAEKRKTTNASRSNSRRKVIYDYFKLIVNDSSLRITKFDIAEAIAMKVEKYRHTLADNKKAISSCISEMKARHFYIVDESLDYVNFKADEKTIKL